MKSQKLDLRRERSLQLLNVQETLNGVLRQLERLERAHDDVVRVNSMKREVIGDTNHNTVEANLKALNVKLGCLQGILEEYRGELWAKAECVRHISNWYMQRRGQYSSCMVQAVIDSLEACYGEYEMKKTLPAALTEEKLNDFAVKLYQACDNYHRKEAKFLKNPQAYVEKKQLYKVDMKRKDNVAKMYTVLEDLRSELNRANQLPAFQDESNGPRFQSSSPISTFQTSDAAQSSSPELVSQGENGEATHETTRPALVITSVEVLRHRIPEADYSTQSDYSDLLNESLRQENKTKRNWLRRCVDSLISIFY